ncbi:MAG: glycosyltransferase family 2 protein [gamma proteobacterium symbiont of Bathyaustriella thionipta]|nr:glycosyltransferase family 2 protein [gamma proteobacterium symbiont of Bathyaustriella thionipta]
MNIPLLSVVVVNWNAGAWLSECASRLFNSDTDLALWVVDNASSDNSIEQLRERYAHESRLHIIQNHHNRGFAAACNQGIESSQSDFILLLNPDCLVEENTLSVLLELLQKQHDIAMLGCRIVDQNGKEDGNANRPLPTPKRVREALFHPQALFSEAGRSVTQQGLQFSECISGSFMLARRTAVEQVGLLDENYFMHWEDVDWCMRFQKQGLKLAYAPQVSVTHIGGVCSTRTPYRILWYKQKGLLKYLHKFAEDDYTFGLKILLHLGLPLRFSLLVLNSWLKRLTP